MGNRGKLWENKGNCGKRMGTLGEVREMNETLWEIEQNEGKSQGKLRKIVYKVRWKFGK